MSSQQPLAVLTECVCAVCVLCVSRLAGYVEALASRLGMQIPDLSPKQADMWQTRVSSHSVSTSLLSPLSCYRA